MASAFASRARREAEIRSFRERRERTRKVFERRRILRSGIREGEVGQQGAGSGGEPQSDIERIVDAKISDELKARLLKNELNEKFVDVKKRRFEVDARLAKTVDPSERQRLREQSNDLLKEQRSTRRFLAALESSSPQTAQKINERISGEVTESFQNPEKSRIINERTESTPEGEFLVQEIESEFGTITLVTDEAGNQRVRSSSFNQNRIQKLASRVNQEEVGVKLREGGTSQMVEGSAQSRVSLRATPGLSSAVPGSNQLQSPQRENVGNDQEVIGKIKGIEQGSSQEKPQNTKKSTQQKIQDFQGNFKRLREDLSLSNLGATIKSGAIVTVAKSAEIIRGVDEFASKKVTSKILPSDIQLEEGTKKLEQQREITRKLQENLTGKAKAIANIQGIAEDIALAGRGVDIGITRTVRDKPVSTAVTQAVTGLGFGLGAKGALGVITRLPRGAQILGSPTGQAIVKGTGKAVTTGFVGLETYQVASAPKGKRGEVAGEALVELLFFFGGAKLSEKVKIPGVTDISPRALIEEEATLQKLGREGIITKGEVENIRVITEARRQLRAIPDIAPGEIKKVIQPGLTRPEKGVVEKFLLEKKPEIFGGKSFELRGIRESSDFDVAIKNNLKEVASVERQLKEVAPRPSEVRRTKEAIGVREEKVFDIKPIERVEQFPFKQSPVATPEGVPVIRVTEQIDRALGGTLQLRKGGKDIRDAVLGTRALVEKNLEEAEKITAPFVRSFRRRRAERLEKRTRRIQGPLEETFPSLAQRIRAEGEEVPIIERPKITKSFRRREGFFDASFNRATQPARTERVTPESIRRQQKTSFDFSVKEEFREAKDVLQEVTRDIKPRARSSRRQPSEISPSRIRRSQLPSSIAPVNPSSFLPSNVGQSILPQPPSVLPPSAPPSRLPPVSPPSILPPSLPPSIIPPRPPRGPPSILPPGGPPTEPPSILPPFEPPETPPLRPPGPPRTPFEFPELELPEELREEKLGRQRKKFLPSLLGTELKIKEPKFDKKMFEIGIRPRLRR